MSVLWLIAVLSLAASECPDDPSELYTLQMLLGDTQQEPDISDHAANCLSQFADQLSSWRGRLASEDSAHSALLSQEAHFRAYAGENEAAAELFGRLGEAGDGHDVAYFAAVVAFLREEKNALLSARATLAAAPEPPGFAETAERIRDSFPDEEPPVWPPNLSVVDRLVACFEYDYATAYGGECEAALDD